VLLRNLNVHHRVIKIPPLDHTTSYLCEIHFNTVLPSVSVIFHMVCRKDVSEPRKFRRRVYKAHH